MEPLRALDLQVLRTVASLHVDGVVDVKEVANEAGLRLNKVLLAVRVLHQHELIDVTHTDSPGHNTILVRLAGAAHRMLHPSAYDTNR